MSCQIQFRTAFNNNYDRVTFEGESLPLAHLRLLIIEKSKFNKSIEFDLEITNEDTNEGKSINNKKRTNTLNDDKFVYEMTLNLVLA